MDLNTCYDEIKNVEIRLRDLILRMKVKISFDRFISFSSLFLYLNEVPYKLIASENYENLETKKRRTIKVQVVHLGPSKLNKLSPEEIHDKLEDTMKLESLFNQYNSLIKLYDSIISSIYSTYKVNFLLSGQDPDKYSELINHDSDDFVEFRQHQRNLHNIIQAKNLFNYDKDLDYTKNNRYLK